MLLQQIYFVTLALNFIKPKTVLEEKITFGMSLIYMRKKTPKFIAVLSTQSVELKLDDSSNTSVKTTELHKERDTK